jgi:hypothetical protein
MALAEAVDNDQVRQLGHQRRQRRRLVKAGEGAEALIDDHLPDAAVHPRDELHELRVGGEAVVRVVRVDDDDRVRLVAIDERLELAKSSLKSHAGSSRCVTTGPDANS